MDDPADVARLTIRNVAAIAQLVEEDASCGFASPAVRASGVIVGAPGEAGSYTERTDECVIDLGMGSIIRRDCDGVSALGMGSATIRAHRTFAGIVQDFDAARDRLPVAVDAPDAYVLNLDEVRLEQFEVTLSDSESSLRVVSGDLSAVISPLMDVQGRDAVCPSATPHMTFTAVRYEPSTVVLHRDTGRVALEVASSDLAAQRGRGHGQENNVKGRVDFAGGQRSFRGDAALDESYDQSAFDARGACQQPDDANGLFICSQDR